jgi:hypothetical protein
MNLTLVATLALVLTPVVFGQGKPAKTATAASGRDRLAASCAQILALSSSDWVAQFSEKVKDADSGQQKTVRALTAYGNCYEERTDRLAASLAKAGSGPLPAARSEFHDFDQALATFTLQALSANDPPADVAKHAYAALYAKQFRYEFLKEYEQAASSRTRPAKPPSQAPASPDSRGDAATHPTTTSPAADDPSSMTMAKNHFGELLDSLPEDKEHNLHSAFGDIIGRSQMSEARRLEIYLYAIFLLESAAAPPFGPPPF